MPEIERDKPAGDVDEPVYWPLPWIVLATGVFVLVFTVTPLRLATAWAFAIVMFVLLCFALFAFLRWCFRR